MVKFEEGGDEDRPKQDGNEHVNEHFSFAVHQPGGDDGTQWNGQQNRGNEGNAHDAPIAPNPYQPSIFRCKDFLPFVGCSDIGILDVYFTFLVSYMRRK